MVSAFSHTENDRCWIEVPFFLKNQIEVSELIGCRVGTKNSGSFFFRVKKNAILFLPEAGMAIGYCNY